MVHLKVGDFSCRTIGFISLIHPTVLPTAEKRRYEILRKTRLERFAGIGDRAGLPNKIRMLYKAPAKFSFAVLLYFTFMKLKERLRTSSKHSCLCGEDV